MIRQQLFIGAALLVGVAIGYFVQPEPVATVVKTADDGASAPARAIADKGESASVAALRTRVRELEKHLADAVRIAEASLTNEVAKVEPERGERRPGSPREWLENVRKTDPERYTQMTNHFARMRLDRRNRQQSRSAFLSSVDTSRMSEGARKTHAKYQDLLARREELDEQFHDPDLADEERQKLMGEMRQVDHQLRQTGASERQLLLNEIAGAIGLAGAEANELVETVKDVVDVTDTRQGHHPPPPPSDR